MKRHVVPAFLDFDTRATLLTQEIREEWDANVKAQHRQNREHLLASLRAEFGSIAFNERLKNFIDLGPAPFSIVGYHNAFFRQVRSAFIYSAYYPALTGACSLGERILNHLVLDLRAFYKATPEYKKIHRKDSFDDWTSAIRVLSAWGVFDAEVAGEFDALRELRNRSIHFRSAMYASVRDDALAAIKHLHKIIDRQFGSFGNQRWFIRGTKGVCFIAKAYQNDPFVKTYYLGQCPPMGPYYALEFGKEGILYFDRKDYPDQEISDEEFKNLYETRKKDMLAPTRMPASPDTVVTILRFG